MNELLKSLHLIWKYLKDPTTKWPTSCEHDIMYVCGVKLNEIPIEDIHQLAKWGFLPGADEDAQLFSIYDERGDYTGEIDFETISQENWDKIKNDLTTCFRSYRFGSC